MHRRDFLKASAAGAIASLSAATYARAAANPNGRINVAVMGVGKGMSHTHGRGYGEMERIAPMKDVEITHICEVDESLKPEAMKVVQGGHLQSAPTWEKDLRKVLEDKDRKVTALLVMPPDHWHALATIWACQAGKHVYVEKPISHNFIEGQRMVQAAKKYKRLVQGGTQRRSSEHYMKARKFLVDDKRLGKVGFVRTWIAGNRPNIGHEKESAPPKGVDYNLWLGPAGTEKELPFKKNRFHYEWHWDWRLGTGELGNNGVHALDGVRMVLGLDAPTRITSGGGKLIYDDDRITPDTQVSVFDFPNGPTLMWEHRIWSKTGVNGENWGIAIYGEKGTMLFDRKGWHIVDGPDYGWAVPSWCSNPSEKAVVEDPSEEHLRNFFEAIKTNGTTKLTCPIEEAHKSTRLCHLGNIAYRVRRAITFDPAKEEIKDDKEATKLMGRETYAKGFELPTAKELGG